MIANIVGIYGLLTSQKVILNPKKKVLVSHRNRMHLIFPDFYRVNLGL
uniref:Uncharacterized protein n=1 Tax=Candidatus Nitrotoga fabula TaxID=2182327 RepID=A0A2X0QWM3_9PROT|nr:protein of unknown function [Candidatus Nitrotoga fabula]